MTPNLTPQEILANEVRDELAWIEWEIRAFISNNPRIETDEFVDWWEVSAQIKLSLRHIEDARMRMGEVIKYSNWWIGIYDTDKK